MKSNVCKIENGTKDLDAILRESEKVAVYNELTHKQTLQLRLICEEIDGMLPNIIDDFSGDFWIDFEDGVCKVNVSLRFEEFTAKKKEELVAIAKNKKNASATVMDAKTTDIAVLPLCFTRFLRSRALRTSNNVSPDDGGNPLRFWKNSFGAQLPKGNSESTTLCLAPSDSSLHGVP